MHKVFYNDINKLYFAIIYVSSHDDFPCTVFSFLNCHELSHDYDILRVNKKVFIY